MRYQKNWYTQRDDLEQHKDTGRKPDQKKIAQQQVEPKDCDRM
jgi:hypothetical protein